MRALAGWACDVARAVHGLKGGFARREKVARAVLGLKGELARRGEVASNIYIIAIRRF